ncbi:hypothetical protein [Chakrabartyella piscis]|uniref:hypothetical protein n=1 Tax=Chakrabartyella piscis TaxID=2918914 RepID=UPI002958DD77|nr:hypothetical protein [Chakrabartyella piscis]
MQASEKHAYQWVIGELTNWIQNIKTSGITEKDAVFEYCKTVFQEHVETRQIAIDSAGNQLENAFVFLENTFGAGQELVIFLTELHTNFYSVWLLQEWDSPKYYQYNESLLFGEQKNKLQEEIAAFQRGSLLY